MNAYVGCDQARPLLEGLVDGELSMGEQLSVETHLRWCETCTLRVSDMRLIGESLRAGAAPRVGGDDPAEQSLTALNQALLVRVRAERAQALPSRVRELFTDMRLLWPALGATVAVIVCVAAAISVLRASTAREPDSLAALITALGSPGSERNPLRPANNGISIPRMVQDDAALAGGALGRMPDDDVVYTVRTIVSRDGSVATYELLLTDDSRRPGSAARVAREQAVLDAVRSTRFVPAQTPLGRAVAVDMVWVIAKTTVVAGPADPVRAATPDVVVPRDPKPDGRRPAGFPVSGRRGHESATA